MSSAYQGRNVRLDVRNHHNTQSLLQGRHVTQLYQFGQSRPSLGNGRVSFTRLLHFHAFSLSGLAVNPEPGSWLLLRSGTRAEAILAPASDSEITNKRVFNFGEGRSEGHKGMKSLVSRFQYILHKHIPVPSFILCASFFLIFFIHELVTHLPRIGLNWFACSILSKNVY